MLSVTHYGREYIDDARARVNGQVEVWRALSAAGAEAAAGGPQEAAYEEAAAAFEHVYFTHLVHVLDSYFVHRQRALEGKDGNALNEVRLLCASLMSNGGKLAADKQIKLAPEKSVLGYAVGDEIRIGEGDFVRLSEAYLAQIEEKFL